ncbi:uncharacterized protein BO88DRAFT_403164 [Aspergillus vadensis CBS 113365]|uniref:Uncharacterized protein n=1 Tax=Aspergillus vadensis (strain CBS 113365 / IMI 142717 / IBT 24658) TaxID=1448311 RepID=A0A319BLH5_ASPVC|nr:hypothetical protein BO88DRAFT_403164 [Aspergillus vadensis CBS 113365]PYH71890.1 hypothetical protein BO88DRAFT_403164 [Aspergillus vadensis CBS 113365]
MCGSAILLVLNCLYGGQNCYFGLLLFLYLPAETRLAQSPSGGFGNVGNLGQP